MDLETKSSRVLAIELTAASFVVLFQELAFIRWLPGQVRVLAYFPNLILLSAFLGLGLGCLRASRRQLLWAWPLSLLLIVAAAFVMSGVIFTHNSVSEHLYLLYYDLPPGAPVVQDVRPPIVAFFILSAASFIPLGQFVARRLQEFQRRSSTLWGYCWDILGSLAGVAAFTVVSFMGAFPVVWFSIFLAVGILFFMEHRSGRLGYLAAAAAIMLVVSQAERAHRYSPYYAINLDHSPETGFTILTNGALHQNALGLARHEATTERQGLIRQGYHTPYRLLARPPRNVLIVGAGTGNDVAVSLDEGAERIDAVEIDPSILELGQLHPNQPYASPRVHAFNADARSFLNDSKAKYDLIVFGTLDSLTRLSALSAVRLDTFVYTLNCIRAARDHLAPDGGVVMYSMPGTDYVDFRLSGMLTEAFGEMPIVITDHFALFNRIYMVGPAFSQAKGEERRAAGPEFLRSVQSGFELPTDDWPYLYLHRRGINSFYLVLIIAFGLFAVVGVFAASGEIRRSLLKVQGVDWEMFLFGLGFLLLETRSVTGMNLVWGATWLTSAVVFGSILAMILLATITMQFYRLSYPMSMVCLVLTLLAVYSLPPRVLLGANVTVKLSLSVLFIGAPIFFAAACFAFLFREREAADTAFGWNLLGAVAGGLLEFASMAIGLKALVLVALAAYLLAFLIRIRKRNLQSAS